MRSDQARERPDERHLREPVRPPRPLGSSPRLGRPRRDFDRAYAALGGVVASTSALLLAYNSLGSGGRFALELVDFGCFAAMFLPSIRARALRPFRVAAASGLLILVAVATPARGSLDLWSYTMYGRIESVHHASAYTHLPAQYPRDPLLRRVGGGWRRTGSVYGPAFVALAAAGTHFTGKSPTENRLLFQGLDGAALAFTLLVLWRRTRDPGALAFLGLNPAVLPVVNGGHNDVLVGCALLCGVLLVSDRRPGLGGLVLAFGALIKLVLLLPIAGLLFWAWRRDKRLATRAGAVVAVVTTLGYWIAGGRAALDPLLHARDQHNRTSVWQFAASIMRLAGHAGHHFLPGEASDLPLVAIAALATVIVLKATRASSGRESTDDSSIAVVVGATTLVFLFAAPYVLPWYSAWVLPVVALAWRSRTAMVSAGQAALILLAYAAPIPVRGVYAVYARGLVPVTSVCLLAYLLMSARQRLAAAPFVQREAKGHHRAPARLIGRVRAATVRVDNRLHDR